MKSILFAAMVTTVIGILGIGGFMAATGNPQPNEMTTNSNTAVNTSKSAVVTGPSTGPSPTIWPLNASLLTGNQLRFELFLNSTSIRSGGGVLIGTEMANSESRYNNVSGASSWPANVSSAYAWPASNVKNIGLNVIENCGTENFPLGMAVLKGHYTSANVSSASSLHLWDSTVPNQGCPAYPAGSTLSYLFSPRSDFALPNPSFLGSSQAMKGAFSVNGYWTGSGWNTGAFHHFDPGIYTLFAADEWGDVLFLYFAVG